MSGPTLDGDPDGMDRHVDKIGVLRVLSGKRVETERGPGDDIGDLVAQGAWTRCAAGAA